MPRSATLLLLGLAACHSSKDSGSPDVQVCQDPSEYSASDAAFHVCFPDGDCPGAAASPTAPSDRWIEEEDGRLHVRMPGPDGSLADAMDAVDGWGPFIPILLPFSGPVDPTTLDEDRFLLFYEVDGMPVQVPFFLFHIADKDLVYLLPTEVLPEATLMGVAVLTGVRSIAGEDLEPSSEYQCLRAGWEDPDQALLAEGVAHLGTVLEAGGYADGDIKFLNSFRTSAPHATLNELSQAMVEVLGSDGPASDVLVYPNATDEKGHLSAEIQALLPTDSGWDGSYPALATYVTGTLAIPDIEPILDGLPVDGSNVEDVHFTLLLPPIEAGGSYPLVIYQHGIASCRETLFSLSDSFNGAGMALAAIDAREHYQRSSPDAHICGSTAYSLAYLNLGDLVGTARRFALNATDIEAFQIFLERQLPGILAEVASKGAAPTVGPFHYVGHSLGGLMGTLYQSVPTGAMAQPDASFTNACGGGGLLTILLPESFVDLPLAPIIENDLLMFLEYETAGALADPLVHMKFMPTRTLIQEAIDDDTIPNISTDLVTWLGGIPILQPDFREVPYLVETDFPAQANLAGGRTGGMAQFQPASHNMLFTSVSEDPDLNARVHGQILDFMRDDIIQNPY